MAFTEPEVRSRELDAGLEVHLRVNGADRVAEGVSTTTVLGAYLRDELHHALPKASSSVWKI